MGSVVSARRAFAIGKTEVTWDQWEACVRDRWCDGPGVELALRTNAEARRTRPSSTGAADRPAIGMSWFDAQNFVGWLNWKSGKDDVYRLPSEAEWEYAARAGTTTGIRGGRSSITTTATSAVQGRGSEERRRAATSGTIERRRCVVPGQCVRPARHARQCLRVGRRLL